MRRRALLTGAALLGVGGLAAAGPARAQPTADQVLADIGVSASDKQRVLGGEFVRLDLPAVSDRDLSLSLVFFARTGPESLSRQILAGDLIGADAQVKQHGRFSAAGSLADLAGLTITSDEANTLAAAAPGDALNLSAAEIAGFAGQGGAVPAVVQRLRQMLLARHQAYRKSGLAGIAPYDRGGGRTTDPAADLRGASQAARALAKYLPAFHAVLLGYPQKTVAGMTEDFRWSKYDIDGKTTYVLTHMMAAGEGAARAVVQRQYYVSTGYDSEQAVAGFLPAQGGSIVVYASHAFTGQVAGFGGSLKRSIGRRVMATKMTEIFEAGRTLAR